MSKMSVRRNVIFILIVHFCVVATRVNSQNCVESGRWCNDDKACCGGCCRNNACMDMYESCLIFDDLCLDHYCPPGLVCYTYKPNCNGCSPIADCKEPVAY